MNERDDLRVASVPAAAPRAAPEGGALRALWRLHSLPRGTDGTSESGTN
jgi:hypothetical protein